MAYLLSLSGDKATLETPCTSENCWEVIRQVRCRVYSRLARSNRQRQSGQRSCQRHDSREKRSVNQPCSRFHKGHPSAMLRDRIAVALICSRGSG